MSGELDDRERLALFEAWGERCVWCRRPLFFSEMEVEHLLPRSLAAEPLRRALEAHGLESEYDLLALEAHP